MKTENILHLISTGERRTVEYKRAWTDLPGNLFETVCAFLNRDGGSIILGVEDNGSIERGVNPDTINQMCGNISNISNNPQRLFPPFLLNPEVSDVNGKKLIIVEVPSSSQVHRFGGKVYDRSNDGDYELRTDAEISALYQRKSTQYSENNIYPYLRLEDLRQETIERARNLIRGVRPIHPWLELSDMDLFRQANLYRRDLTTGQEGFTLAALIFFVQMGWAEHLGTGIRNLYKYVPQYTGRDPLIDDEDIYKVEIGLPLALQQKVQQRNTQKNIQKDIQRKLESLSLRLTSEQMSVAAIIGSDSSITRVEIGEQLGLPDASVNACIIALKKKGVLVRIGGKRYGKWGLVIAPTINEDDKITKE